MRPRNPWADSRAGGWDSCSVLLQGHKAWSRPREGEREPEGLALARTRKTKSTRMEGLCGLHRLCTNITASIGSRTLSLPAARTHPLKNMLKPTPFFLFNNHLFYRLAEDNHVCECSRVSYNQRSVIFFLISLSLPRCVSTDFMFQEHKHHFFVFLGINRKAPT